jgi:hypothetical protein
MEIADTAWNGIVQPAQARQRATRGGKLPRAGMQPGSEERRAVTPVRRGRR